MRDLQQHQWMVDTPSTLRRVITTASASSSSSLSSPPHPQSATTTATTTATNTTTPATIDKHGHATTSAGPSGNPGHSRAHTLDPTIFTRPFATTTTTTITAAALAPQVTPTTAAATSTTTNHHHVRANTFDPTQFNRQLAQAAATATTTTTTATPSFTIGATAKQEITYGQAQAQSGFDQTTSLAQAPPPYATEATTQQTPPTYAATMTNINANTNITNTIHAPNASNSNSSASNDSTQKSQQRSVSAVVKDNKTFRPNHSPLSQVYRVDIKIPQEAQAQPVIGLCRQTFCFRHSYASGCHVLDVAAQT
jgi:hypothetical protein